MDALARAKYLDGFGVTQYRRRSLRVETVTTETVVESVVELEKEPKAEFIGSPTKKVNAELLRPDGLDNPVSKQENSNAINFDLLMWRTDKILVLDFSVAETETIQLKHKLANNVLKALWPQEFRGVEAQQYAWPIVGSDASVDLARDWLMSLMAGHLQNNSDIPIWVMGELGLKMLFPKQSDFAELVGTSTMHDQLGAKIFVSQSLETMLQDTVAKAQTWQILKPLS